MVPTTIGYLVFPYVLIATFQYQVAKDALTYSSVFVLMGMRYLIASSLIFCVARRFNPIFNKDTVLLALFTFSSTCFWGLGLLYLSPSESAVLTYTMPLFAIPISILVLSEKATIKEWVGAFVGLVGVMIYSTPFLSNAFTLIGGVLTLMNAFFWALYTVYYRKLKGQDQAMTVATQLLLAAALFFVLSPLEFKLVLRLSFWFDLVYLGLLSGVVSYFLWNAMARSHKVGRMTTLIYLTPVAATLAQSVETSVMPSFITLIGLCVMTFGVCVSTFGREL
jgi:drug/metabolite transporter (DMT)-like permease